MTQGNAEAPQRAYHEDLMFVFGMMLLAAGFVRGIHVNGMLNYHWSVTWVGSAIVQCIGLAANFVRPKHPLYQMAERYLGYIPGKQLSVSVTAMLVFWQQYIYTKLYIIGVSETWLLDPSDAKVPLTPEQFDVMVSSSTMFLTTLIMYGTFYLPGILTVNPPNWWLMRNLREAMRVKLMRMMLEDMDRQLQSAKQLEDKGLEAMLAGDNETASYYLDAASERRQIAGETFSAIEGGGNYPLLPPPS